MPSFMSCVYSRRALRVEGHVFELSCCWGVGGNDDHRFGVIFRLDLSRDKGMIAEGRRISSRCGCKVFDVGRCRQRIQKKEWWLSGHDRTTRWYYTVCRIQ